MGGSEEEIHDLTKKLEVAAEAFGMEIHSTGKSKVLVDSASKQAAINIMLNGQKLNEVDSLNYSGLHLP